MTKVIAKVMSDLHYCIWRYDDMYDRWDTGCEEAFAFIDGSPESNGFKFCPYCGGGVVTDRGESNAEHAEG